MSLLIIDCIFLGLSWYLFGTWVGLFVGCFCVVYGILVGRYVMFAEKVVKMQRKEIERLGGMRTFDS